MTKYLLKFFWWLVKPLEDRMRTPTLTKEMLEQVYENNKNRNKYPGRVLADLSGEVDSGRTSNKNPVSRVPLPARSARNQKPNN